MTHPSPPTPHPPLGPRATRAALAVDRAVYAFVRHWLAAANTLLLGWVALAALAPLLLASGHHPAASLIYALNRPFCHQRPDRSFHLLGEKMACCQRCFAIYGGLALVGLAFVAFRGLRPLAWPRFALCCLPIALDALTQAAALRESTLLLRVSTGALVAVGLAWAVFPALEHGFRDIRATLELRFDRLVAQGRARPLADAPSRPEG